MEEVKKFLTYKNSRLAILACCALALLSFFLPTISVLGKGSFSCFTCVTDFPFSEVWWAIFFLIGPAVGGYLAYKSTEIKPIAGYCLAAPVLIFLICAPKGLSFAGLSFVYFLAVAVAIAVPFLTPNKKAEE